MLLMIPRSLPYNKLLLLKIFKIIVIINVNNPTFFTSQLHRIIAIRCHHLTLRVKSLGNVRDPVDLSYIAAIPLDDVRQGNPCKVDVPKCAWTVIGSWFELVDDVVMVVGQRVEYGLLECGIFWINK